MSSVTIPASPSAPTSFELTYMDAVAMNVSPFNGIQQVQRWGVSARLMKCSFTIKSADAGNWKTFLENLQGSTNTFKFTSAFGTAYSEVGTRDWRLRSGARTVAVGHDRVYMLN